MAAQVNLTLLSQGESCGYVLRISALPGRPGPERAAAAGGAPAMAELVEGQEYRYEWIGPPGTLCTEPSEVFQADSSDGRAGRLRPGLAVGFLEVSLHSPSIRVGSLELQVRSRKLQFEDEYRWMLRDIATELTELLMERFAASELRFKQDDSRDAVTLYQRFEFLRALLQSGSFTAAIQEILRRPHTGWSETRHEALLSRGLPASASAAKKLARAGFSSDSLTNGTADSTRRIEQARTEATQDTTPNRFIKHALQHWLQILGDIENGLSSAPPTAPILRGRWEVATLAAELDQLLHEDLFRGVGRLTRFPGDDQVLQKREGYRDILRAYLEFELGAQLSWEAPDTHSASSRDIATLYEYWAFLQLAKSVAVATGATFDLRPLVQVDKSGLSVGISKGQERVFSGLVLRSGRAMEVDLWFNRTYRAPEGSWTRALRPDYSLTIRPQGKHRPHQVVNLHFDAEYRVQFIEDLLRTDAEILEEDDAGTAQRKLRGEATPGDVMKMHAYRDAIRRTSGAYVLYPGGDTEVGKPPLREFHELLPGLGAFVLRPTNDGDVLGDQQLREFVSQVIDHAAAKFTSHERDRHWHERVYGAPETEPPSDVMWPPPTTSVFLAFVKSPAHWRWIRRTSSYNLRAVGRIGGVAPEAALFQSQLVLLYCPMSGDVALARMVSDPQLISAEVLLASGYPEPRGPEYWVIELSWLNQPNWLSGITASSIERFLEREGSVLGAPSVVAWGDFGGASNN